MKPTEPDKWWFSIDISVSGFQSFNYHQCTWFLIMATALLKKFWTSSTSTSVICEESFPISHSVIQLTMKWKKWCWKKICRSTIFKLNFSHNVDHTCHSSGWETYIFLRNHLLSSSAKISWVAFWRMCGSLFLPYPLRNFWYWSESWTCFRSFIKAPHEKVSLALENNEWMGKQGRCQSQLQNHIWETFQHIPSFMGI